MSENPDDLSYLTPGHFLIGAPLVAPPETSVLEERQSRLTRWRLLQQMTERLWTLWTRDYLRSLQHRYKWRQVQCNVRIGDIVIVKNENLPPKKWELGRIIQCYADNAGLVRSCQIKTANNTIKRPVHKLCVLPTTEDNKSDICLDN